MSWFLQGSDTLVGPFNSEVEAYEWQEQEDRWDLTIVSQAIANDPRSPQPGD